MLNISLNRNISELLDYKEMLSNLVRKDLRTRYKGSVLGFLWTFVNPLLQLIVYSIVFSTVLRMNVENFSMFLFVGLVPWIFFSTSIQISSSIIISNKNLVKKVYFPRMVLPLSVVLSNLVNMLLTFIVVFIALLVNKIELGVTLIYLPAVIFVETFIILGISLVVSAVTVYLRDIEHILNIIIMAWFYLTPIVYPIDIIPAQYVGYFEMNPMFYIITMYRDILYYNGTVNIQSLIYPLILGLSLTVIGFIVFIKLERNFAEEL